jgi:hypothetical protein
MRRTVIVDGNPLHKYVATSEGHIYNVETGMRLDPRNGVIVLSRGRQLKSVSRSIATVVLETFRGPDPSGFGRPHFLDHDKRNLRVENLVWKSDITGGKKLRAEQVISGEDAAMSFVQVPFSRAELNSLRQLPRMRDQILGESTVNRALPAVLRLVVLEYLAKETAKWRKRTASTPPTTSTPPSSSSDPFA